MLCPRQMMSTNTFNTVTLYYSWTHSEITNGWYLTAWQRENKNIPPTQTAWSILLLPSMDSLAMMSVVLLWSPDDNVNTFLLYYSGTYSCKATFFNNCLFVTTNKIPTILFIAHIQIDSRDTWNKQIEKKKGKIFHFLCHLNNNAAGTSV